MQQVLVLPRKLFSVAAAITGAKFLLKRVDYLFPFSFSFITYLQSSTQMGEYSSLLNNRCLTTACLGPAVKVLKCSLKIDKIEPSCLQCFPGKKYSKVMVF